MDRYANRNHRVNGREIEKVASVYDALGVSNRQPEAVLNVSSLTPVENDQLREHIAKTAGDLEGHALLKTAAAGVEKAAFLSGGMDLFTHAKGALTSKLGIPEETAHQLASPVVTNALKIQGTYGGDEGKIVDRLVDEMQGHLMDHTSGTVNAAQTGADAVRAAMAPTNTKSLEEHVKQRLIQEAGVSAYDADRLKKTIVLEARDLVTVLRPHKMDVIADGIVNLILEHRDPSIAYNLKDSELLVNELRSVLSAG